MKKSYWGVIGLCLPIFITCTSREEKAHPLLIATSANMQFAMENLVDSFSIRTDIPCQLIVGSSGKLTAQIIEGAPFDVFVSADMKYPEEIFQSGRGVSAPKVFVLGSLVLWSMNADLEPSLGILTTESIQHIALANPQYAPYGKAAYELLSKKGILTRLKSKLVFGESISQVNQFISTQAADIGFTAKSVVLSPAIKEKGRWIELEPESYPPIEQGAILIKKEKEINPAAKSFYTFLFSSYAKEVLTAYGYSSPESAHSQ